MNVPPVPKRPTPPRLKPPGLPVPPGGPTQLRPENPQRRPNRKLSRPPWIPILIVVALVGLEVWLLTKGRSEVTLHLVASLVGMFGSVVLLGWFRQDLNIRQSTNFFSDWRGPFEATRYMSVLTATTWLISSINLYFSVYEACREDGFLRFLPGLN